MVNGAHQSPPLTEDGSLVQLAPATVGGGPAARGPHADHSSGITYDNRGSDTDDTSDVRAVHVSTLLSPNKSLSPTLASTTASTSAALTHEPILSLDSLCTPAAPSPDQLLWHERWLLTTAAIGGADDDGHVSAREQSQQGPMRYAPGEERRVRRGIASGASWLTVYDPVLTLPVGPDREPAGDKAEIKSVRKLPRVIRISGGVRVQACSQRDLTPLQALGPVTAVAQGDGGDVDEADASSRQSVAWSDAVTSEASTKDPRLSDTMVADSNADAYLRRVRSELINRVVHLPPHFAPLADLTPSAHLTDSVQVCKVRAFVPPAGFTADRATVSRISDCVIDCC